MKTERLIAMMLLLLDRHKISATALAEIFDVSTRTIYRDINALSLAGIPITTTQGVYGGISIMSQYKVDKKLFSTHDLATLLIGLNTISSTLNSQELTNTLIKVQSLIPQQQQQAIELASSQLSINLSSWKGSSAIQVTIDQLKNCLKQRLIIAFTYYDRNGTKSSRQVEPYRLILKESSWYLEGYCLMRDDFRVFKLVRINQLQITDSTFTPRPFTPNQSAVDKAIHSKLITVTLLIDASLRDIVIEEFNATIIAASENKLRVTLPFLDENVGYDMLLRLGARAECLGPSQVREKLIKKIDALRDIYADDNA